MKNNVTNILSESEENNVLKKVQKARIELLLQYSFFGILSLKLILKKDYSIPTAGTDGRYLYYNPVFVNTLKKTELNFIIVHEIMHCALRHIWRQGNRNHNKFNAACDYAIHNILIEEHNNVISMPSSALYNEEYKGLTAEEIYDILSDDYEYQGFDDHSVWNRQPDKNEETNSENTNGSSISLEKEWESNVINAAKTIENSSKDAGSIPGYFKRYIDKLTNPIKDWRVLLREFIEPETNDYTFTQPDYRIDFDTFGCFMPSFNETTEKLNQIVFWIDTSGSICDDELNKIYSEVAGAVEQFDKFNGYLGFFDHIAYEPKEFNDIISLKEIKPVGGGGTNFDAPFNFMKENKDFENVKCTIILTDGYCNFPSEETIGDMPTIWLITTKDIVSPYGQSIYLPLSDN